MCGRFTLQHSTEEVKRRYNVQETLLELHPRYNIAPSQQVAAIVQSSETDSRLVLTSFKWGLIPAWAKDPSIGNRIINARAETLQKKPAFRKALLERRCIIPADGFYEWTGEGRTRTPVYIRRPDGELFGMAGLWEEWMSPQGVLLRTCAIITVPPNEFIAPLHHRMAAILNPEDERFWLDLNVRRPEQLLDVLKPYPEPLESYRVSTRVNSTAVEGPECIEPATLTTLFEL